MSWAKQQYERAQGLSAAGVVSKQDLDQAKATMDAAQAQMDSLDAQVREQEVQLHYYKVVAPRERDCGRYSGAGGRSGHDGDAVDHVDQPGSLEAYVYVPIEHSCATEDESAGAGARQRRQGAGRFADQLYFSAGG